MRLAESGDALLHLVRLQVDHFNGMIAGGGDEQAIARFVDGQDGRICR